METPENSNPLKSIQYNLFLLLNFLDEIIATNIHEQIKEYQLQ